jgi:hypothetical protein
MDVTCIKCNHVTVLPLEINKVELACGNCGTVTSFAKKAEGDIIRRYDYQHDKRIGLNVGQQGELFGVKYTVTGMLVKRVAGTFYWKEYILDGDNGQRVFLSETNGHWIFLEEEPDQPDITHIPDVIYYQNTRFQLYGDEKVTLAYAEGVFDYELPAKAQSMIEYINPPYILSFERDEDGQILFVGRHMSSRKIAKAFGVSWMPNKTGVGVVQPALVSFTNSILVLAVTALLLIFSHIFIYRDKAQEQLLSDTIPFSLYADKEYVSRSFEVQGATGTLRIQLQADVDNSWAYVDVGLVNETTGAEEYIGKDIEYYYGYEGGENWSEGDNNVKMYLCGVAPGKYHLTLKPQKDALDGKTTVVNADVTWNPPSKRNVIIPIIFMAVVGFGLYKWAQYSEMKRWEDSDYSPFDE